MQVLDIPPPVREQSRPYKWDGDRGAGGNAAAAEAGTSAAGAVPYGPQTGAPLRCDPAGRAARPGCQVHMQVAAGEPDKPMCF